MRIIEQLQSEFTTESRQLGEAYAERERVELLELDEEFAYFAVRGRREYTASIRNADDGLHFDCNCPAFRTYGPCKHIWASLIAYEEVLEDYGFLDVDDSGFQEFNHRARLPQSAELTWRDEMQVLQSAPFRIQTPPAAIVQDQETNTAIHYFIAPPSDDALFPEIGVVTRQQNADSEWEKTPPPEEGGPATNSIAQPIDREILLLSESLSNLRLDDEIKLAEAETFFSMLIRRMAESSRLFAATAPSEVSPQPLRLTDDSPWDLQLVVTKAPDSFDYILFGELHRENGEPRILKANAPDVLITLGWVVAAGELSPLTSALAPEWIALLTRTPPLTIPRRDAHEWLSQYFKCTTRPTTQLPEELRYTEVRPTPVFHLEATAGDQDFNYGFVQARLLVHYGNIVCHRLLATTTYDPASRTLIKRDNRAEAKAQEHLDELGFERHWSLAFGEESNWDSCIHSKAFSEAARTLLSEGWQITASGKRLRMGGGLGASVKKSGIDWFDIQGAATFDDQEVPLPTLLAAIRDGQGQITLGDGSIGILPEEWLKRSGALLDLGLVEGDSIRFRASQAALLDAMLVTLPGVDVDAHFQHVQHELEQFSHITPEKAPDTFQGTLRPYQEEGLGWLQFLRRLNFGGCLADDMGLGKTIQALALLETHRTSATAPSLVVVPRSLIFNWIAEANRFTPQMRVLDHGGTQRTNSPETFRNYDLILMTYGTLRNDIAMLARFRFDTVILDEAQSIKNANTVTSKAARLLQANHRIAMSGTPIENHLGELHSLFEFLNRGLLGASNHLKGAKGSREIDEATRALLAKALRPYILRRTKQQVVSDLPIKTEETLYCDLEGKQREHYDELRKHYKQALLTQVDNNGMNKSHIQVLEALLRLRQAACHPALVDKTLTHRSSAKLELLFSRIHEIIEEGHKALIFSQFVSLLTLVRSSLDREKVNYEYLDGSTTNRQNCVNHFQEDEDCSLFLISLKAGGLGLNLTSADYVFLLDPWWNPAVEAQAIDRAHRIGQTRPVFAYRIVARDTVEEKILELQNSKRELADAIITSDNSVIRDLTREDLVQLLS